MVSGAIGNNHCHSHLVTMVCSLCFYKATLLKDPTDSYWCKGDPFQQHVVLEWYRGVGGHTHEINGLPEY
jgi:hypothetical protein